MSKSSVVHNLSEEKELEISFELTCPWDGNIERSHAYKEEKYAPLIADLSRNFTTYQFSIETYVRGQVSSDNKKRLKAFVYRACVDAKPVFKLIVQVCSKMSLLSSFSIFTARNEPSWENPTLLVNY